jgi:hypothetical protein
MAKFDPPFSNTADKRFPTSDERESGFPCGPADQLLFNGLFHRLEAEIGEVINHAGIIQTDDRFTQLREAIEQLISAATGGGDPSQYLLLSQAATRLPIFPEVQNTDGVIAVTSPSAGTVRIPGGVTFLHRGIVPVTTIQEDFATVANKIYHLRWDPTNEFRLIETGDAVYNPGSLAETNLAFDTKYDDMLVSRVITNAANVATITNLANKTRLAVEGNNGGAMTTLFGKNGSERLAQLSWNFSRTPILSLHPRSIGTEAYPGAPGFRGPDNHDHDFNLNVETKTRYGGTVRVLRDYATAFTIGYQAFAL